jgi:methyl-accepting chemotaxis protein
MPRTIPRPRDIRLGRRLAVAFGAVGALVLVSAGGGLSAVAEQRRLADEVNAAAVVLREAETARFQIADVSGWQGLVVADVAAYGPEKALGPEGYNRSGLLESKQAVYEWLDGVDTSAMDDDERAAFEQMRPQWDGFFARDDQIVEWLSTGRQDAFVTTVGDINGGESGAAYDAILGLADQMQSSADERAVQVRAEQDRAQTRATLLLSIVGVLAVLFAVGLAWTASRSIVTPVRRVKRSLDALASGDLTVPTGVDTRDEVGQMAAALDSATANLRDVLASVVASADAVAASSEELAASSAQISASAEETSAQSGVVAGAAEEVSRNV